MLTKLRYAAGEGTSETSSGESSGSSSAKGDSTRGLQIVGMSATMPNVAAVADWLQVRVGTVAFLSSMNGNIIYIPDQISYHVFQNVIIWSYDSICLYSEVLPY